MTRRTSPLYATNSCLTRQTFTGLPEKAALVLQRKTPQYSLVSAVSALYCSNTNAKTKLQGRGPRRSDTHQICAGPSHKSSGQRSGREIYHKRGTGLPVRKTVRTHDVTCVATKVGTCWRSAQSNGSTCSPLAQQAVKQPPDSKRRAAGCATEDSEPCRASSHATSRGGSYGAALDVQLGQVSQKLRVLRVQLSPPAQMRAIR